MLKKLLKTPVIHHPAPSATIPPFSPIAPNPSNPSILTRNQSCHDTAKIRLYCGVGSAAKTHAITAFENPP
jgi:hypothetical protein